jgi:hypothetical protein
MLRTVHDDLSDLATGHPDLLDDEAGTKTGVVLRKRLGIGGMSTVFLAERSGATSPTLSPYTPDRLAIKFMQVGTVLTLAKHGSTPIEFLKREVVALERLGALQPPTPFAVAFYGCGLSDVETRGGVRRIPWLALEYVDGGADGSSLTERVERARPGVDPLRARRMVRGIVEGLLAIHRAQLVHRDLKPDNVLVAGPIDDEIPKLTDYGVARVEGLSTTVAGATLAYAGFEQLVSTVGVRNPLVGRWSDVHALAAVIWFILGGEQWYVDQSWFGGRRRSLRTAGNLHPGFVQDDVLVDALDACLARAAAPRLPAIASTMPGADNYLQFCRHRYPAMFTGPERYADVDSFAADLLPVLDRVAEAWTARAARENRPATVYRPTMLVNAGGDAKPEPTYTIEELAAAAPHPIDPSEPTLAIAKGAAAFQADGRVLAISGSRLYFFVDQRPFAVSSPDKARDAEHRARLRETRWVCWLGDLGYAIVGPKHLLMLRGGAWRELALPVREGGAAGGEVGEVIACLGGRGRLSIVTAETDDGDGGPELWRTIDGATWTGPTTIPFNGGEVHAAAEGPYGTIFVGARGKKARATFLAPDGGNVVYTNGLASAGDLTVATGGNERELWAASSAGVLRFDRATAELETEDLGEAPVAMALDLVGIPWLVTERGVHRREALAGATSKWRRIHVRPANKPPFAAIGFTPEGVRVLDAGGSALRIIPADIAQWRRSAG